MAVGITKRLFSTKKTKCPKEARESYEKPPEQVFNLYEPELYELVDQIDGSKTDNQVSQDLVSRIPFIPVVSKRVHPVSGLTKPARTIPREF